MSATRELRISILGDAKGAQKAFDDVEKSASLSIGNVGKVIAGAGIGAGIAASISNGLDIGAGRAKLQAQLDLTGEDAKKAGDVAGDLFRGGFGSSMEDTNAAIAAVGKQLQHIGDTSEEDLGRISGNVLNLAETFDQDLNGIVGATSTLLLNGIAPNADVAMDVITRGFQKGVDKGGDFLDTLTEYSPMFSQLGLDASDATDLLAQGLENGARNADFVADAIKEFSIRAIDGSKTTAEGFKALGLDADDMAQKLAAGGPAAKTAFGTVLNELGKIKDPVAQAQAGVALFGTKFEDLGAGVITSLDPLAGGLDKVEGATKRLGDTLASTDSAKLETAKRQVTGFFTDIGVSALNIEGPIGTAVGLFGGVGAAALPMVASIGPAALAVKGMGPAFMTAGSGALSFAGSMIGAGVSAVGAAIPVIIAWAPVILTIAAIGAAAYLLWRNWDTVFGFVKGIASDAAGFVTRNLDAIAMVVLAPIAPLIFVATRWNEIWGGIKAGVGAAAGFIGDKIGWVVGIVTGMPGRISAVTGGMWDGIKNAFRAAVNFVIRGWNSIQFKLPSFAGLTIMGKTIIPGFEGPTLGVPKINELAEGGFIPARAGGFLAVVGEGRDDEIVAPEPMLRRIMREETAARGGGVTLHLDMTVQVAGSVVAEADLADALLPKLREGFIRMQRYMPLGFT